jgi:hypothetical protein
MILYNQNEARQPRFSFVRRKSKSQFQEVSIMTILKSISKFFNDYYDSFARKDGLQ